MLLQLPEIGSESGGDRAACQSLGQRCQAFAVRAAASEHFPAGRDPARLASDSSSTLSLRPTFSQRTSPASRATFKGMQEQRRRQVEAPPQIPRAGRRGGGNDPSKA
jgi:hypothetical protein